MSLKDQVTGTLGKMNKGTLAYKKNLRDLRRTADKTWSSIKTGAIVAGMAVAGLTTVGVGSGLKMASELEAYRGTLNVVLKDTERAGKMMQWASQFANITPFDTKAVIEGTVRLQAYGINAQQTMGAIGDMASVMNKDLMQAIEAVADAQTGELERMKEFGLTKAMIQKKSDEMFRNQTVINNKGQIIDQQKFNQALFALMDDRFAGGMAKQSKTFKGLMSTIKGTWQTALAEMAGVTVSGDIKEIGLFAAIKNDMKTITDLAKSGQLQTWASNFGDALVKVYNGAKSVTNTIVSIATFVKDNWSVISPIVYGVVGAFVAYKGILILTKAYTMALTVATYAQTVAQTGLNVAIRANPLGILVTLIGLAIAAGVYLIKNWQQVKLTLMNTWNTIVDVAEWGVNKYLSFANFMIRVYKFAWDSIKFAGISIWDGLVSSAEKGIQGILKPINMIREELGKDKIKVDFSFAKVGAEKPKWDSEFNLIPKLDFSGAKFSEDSIMTQTKKAQAEKEKKKDKKEDQLIAALDANTNATSDNTSATGSNTNAILNEDRSSTQIADGFYGRIQRKVYGTT
jgi:hypothetical protein